jgi:hypothetical protein
MDRIISTNFDTSNRIYGARPKNRGDAGKNASRRVQKRDGGLTFTQ